MEENVNTEGMVEVYLSAGSNIDETYERLLTAAARQKTVVFTKFNGHILLSTDTIDEMYKKVTGNTRAENKEKKRKWLEDYEKKEKEHQEKIPSLTEKYVKEARGIILDSQLEYWDKIVPIRLDDLYHGMELDQTLDISKIMGDESVDYDTRLHQAYKCFMDAGNSGMSAGLVASMLRKFCPHGEDIADAVMNFRFDKE